jgi:hypothetical protein
MTQKNILFGFALSIISLFSFNSLNAQATTTVNSSNGYSVNISLTPQSIIAPNSCQYGYNYNTKIDYIITFSGNNIPKKLYTLQTNMNCNNQANFTNLPLGGGSGQATTHSNPYNSASDCGTATVQSMNCNSFNLIIEGPGIPYQNIYMPNTIALPVKFASLEVKENFDAIDIYWSTSLEINNDFFTVERSNDGSTWNSIQTVKASKESGLQSYSVSDNNPANGVNYYRIKQQDIDGNITYSSVLVKEFNATAQVSIFPNPSNSFFKIEANNIQDMNIQITNMNGQVIKIDSNIENNSITYDVSGLNAGIYNVQINNNGDIQNHKITVIK